MYGCRSCAVHVAIVFCRCCAARLCLHCDAAVHVHAEAALHPRAPLCDACGDAPAAVRCNGTVTLCAVCVARGAPGVTRTGVATYTGCPGPADIARLISVDPPQPQQDLKAWLADRIRIMHGGQDHQLPLPLLLPPDWDVAMETARLEKMLADSYTPELLSSSPAGYCHQQQPKAACTENARHLMAQPAQMTTGASDHDKTLQRASTTMDNKTREQRERAKQRYIDKRKNRSFCKQILYASRKVRADTRKRFKGRFVKAQAQAQAQAQHDDHHPQQLQIDDDDGPSSSTSTVTASVNRETSSS